MGVLPTFVEVIVLGVLRAGELSRMAGNWSATMIRQIS